MGAVGRVGRSRSDGAGAAAGGGGRSARGRPRRPRARRPAASRPRRARRRSPGRRSVPSALAAAPVLGRLREARRGLRHLRPQALPLLQALASRTAATGPSAPARRCRSIASTSRFSIASITRCCIGAMSGRPRNRRASSGVQSTSMLTFMRHPLAVSDPGANYTGRPLPAGCEDRRACPTRSPTPPAPTSSSTRTTRSTGASGRTRRWRWRSAGGQADPALGRLRRLPLVPRHGARELREPGDRGG